MFKLYYNLTKPGIIYGNALTAAAAFFLASKNHISPTLLLSVLAGLSLVIASGCVFNNYADRKIDKNMERTKNRALVTGQIPGFKALIFASILLLLGVVILHYHTTTAALLAALLGFFVYVFLYTPLKRRSVYATLIGSIAGATPPVVGYTAVTGKLDAGAIILFIILVVWQMPHFYSIAIYRLKDYAAAQVPVLPVKKGIPHTKIYILIYIIAFLVASIMLTLFKFTGYIYLVVVALLSLAWLRLSLKGFAVADNTQWARKMFHLSLIVLTSLCVIIPIDAFINKIFKI